MNTLSNHQIRYCAVLVTALQNLTCDTLNWLSVSLVFFEDISHIVITSVDGNLTHEILRFEV